MRSVLPDWAAALVLAPFIGSFLGVLIRRLPTGRRIMWARSACEACGHRLGGPEMVPLASYLLLRGRCRACHAPIALFHPLIELAALAVAASAAAGHGGALLWADCLLGWTLLALGWIDAETMLLPDVLTLPLLLAGLGATFLLTPGRLAAHAAGAAAGYLLFRGIARLYRALRGREGLGEGDAKLLAAAGAWVGWAALPEVVLVAALLGLGAAAIARLRGQALSGATAIPFGPCLALALWLVRLAGTG